MSRGDRNIIDAQLPDAIFDFERTTGVVTVVKGDGTSKSGELATALSGGKKIVVCTIQTFPFALEAVRELAATKGKRFAVIADEAPSSQTGEAAAKLKAVLSPEELEELGDGGEVSMDDVLAAQMAARADDTGITFVAFTATRRTRRWSCSARGLTLADRQARIICRRRSTSTRCGSLLRSSSSSTCSRTTRRTSWPSSWPTTEGTGRQGSRTQCGHEGDHGLGPAPSLQLAQKVQTVVEHFRELVAPC